MYPKCSTNLSVFADVGIIRVHRTFSKKIPGYFQIFQVINLVNPRLFLRRFFSFSTPASCISGARATYFKMENFLKRDFVNWVSTSRFVVFFWVPSSLIVWPLPWFASSSLFDFVVLIDTILVFVMAFGFLFL